LKRARPSYSPTTTIIRWIGKSQTLYVNYCLYVFWSPFQIRRIVCSSSSNPQHIRDQHCRNGCTVSKRCHTMITLRDATRTKAASMPCQYIHLLLFSFYHLFFSFVLLTGSYPVYCLIGFFVSISLLIHGFWWWRCCCACDTASSLYVAAVAAVKLVNAVWSVAAVLRSPVQEMEVVWRWK
jgi:hypothetical protein